jgi:molecular chaperone GrpE (heat shock protein)
MKEQEFNLQDFRKHLQQLERELTEGTKQDPDYQGEIDEVIEALKRLTQELKDKKYEQVLPDLFRVLEFLDMVEENFEEEELED